MTISLVQGPVNQPSTPHLETTSAAMAAVLTNTPAVGNLCVWAGYGTDVSAAFTPQNSYTTDRSYNGTHAIGRVGVGSKVAGASEPKTITVNLNASQPHAMAIAEFTGIDTSVPGAVVATSGQGERPNNTGHGLTVSTDVSVPASTYVDVLLVGAVMASAALGGSGDMTMTGFTMMYSALEGGFGYRIVSTPSGVQQAISDWTSNAYATGVLVAYKGAAVEVFPGTLELVS